MNFQPTCLSFFAVWCLLMATTAAAEEPAIATTSATATSALSQALAKAGENRGELEKALEQSPDSQREGMEFLILNMPAGDLKSLSAEFLREHVDFAYKAWEASPWKDQVSKETFLNNVLPYANINERRDAWRKDFYERFQPLVKDAKTPGEAAAILNQKIFGIVDVRYSTKRPKADQSPYESMDAKLASCTGLSIILVDACRAVGVPARLVCVPVWADNSGNHTWVEVWDDGWHFTGAAEPSGDKLDQGWFVGRAAKAKRDEKLYAIYAISFKKTPLTFPMKWQRHAEDSYALNVTDRYTELGKELPDGFVELMFRALDGQDRCCATLKLKDAEGKVIFEGQTKDERFDANDHLTATVPAGVKLTVEIERDGTATKQDVQAEPGQKVITLELDDDRRE